MTGPTRTHLAVLVCLLVTSGCLGGGTGGAQSTATTTETAVPTGTTTGTAATSPTTTATTASHESAMQQADPDKDVTVRNGWNRSVEVGISVIRERTGETVHNGTYTLSPGEERTVYTLAEADPEGVETFTVVAHARGTTERVDVETSTCYGDAHAEIQDDGSLYLYYAIC